MQITIEYDGDVASAPTGFETAVQEAVSYLDNLISNNISVTIVFGWGQSGPISANMDGDGAVSQPLWFGYSTGGSQISSIVGALDTAYAANGLSAFVSPQLLAADFAAVTEPNTGVNVDEAEALGLSTQSVVEYVALNSTLSWNFDVNTLTNPNFDDAIAALLHEITHDLGRTAGDPSSGLTTIFDMFRYNSGGELQLAPGGGFFSLNGSVLTLPFEAANLDPGDWAESVLNDANGFVSTGNAYNFSTIDIIELKALGFQINTPAADAPTVTAGNFAVIVGQAVAASTLFSVTNPILDPITFYEFWDAGGGSGHWAVNGVAQPNGQAIEVAASQLATVTYVAGATAGTDQLYVWAYDGAMQAWTPQTAFTASTTTSASAGPVVITNAATVVEGDSLPVWSLISSISNPNNDNITQYRFIDTGTDGTLSLNGMTTPDGQSITVNVNDVGAVVYQAGSIAGVDQVLIEAFDATTGMWSVSSVASVTVAAEALPYVRSFDVPVGAPIQVSGPATNLQMVEFLINDVGDNVTQYRFEDLGTGNGHLTLNAVAQPDGQWVTVNVGDVYQVQYVGGSSAGSENVQVEVFDASQGAWSAPLTLTATTTAANHVDPVVNTAPVSLAEGASIAASLLIGSVANPSNDAITAYRFAATGSIGVFELNGVLQPSNGQDIVVAATNLSTLQYVAGSIAGTQSLTVEAYDATTQTWSPLSTAVATVTTSGYTAPTIAVHNASLAERAGLNVSSLFTLANPSGDTVGYYQFFNYSNGNGGHFTVNGVSQPYGAGVVVAAADLDTVQYVGGTGPGGETLSITPYDSTTSTWEATSFLTVTTTTTPVVSTINQAPSSGTLTSGASDTFTLDFSEAVIVTGAPTLTLSNGETASYASGSGTSALTFSYTVSANDPNVASLAATALNLNGGSINDSLGDTAALSLSGLTQTGPEVNATTPTVEAVVITPATGTLPSGSTVTFALDFNEVMTVTGTPTLALSNGATATLVGGSGTHVLTFAYTPGAAGVNVANLTANDIVFGGATIVDSIGNVAGASLGSTVERYAAIVTGGQAAGGIETQTGAGNDLFFVGGAGVTGDHVTGGSGLNTAVFTGPLAQYAVQVAGGGVVTVTDTIAGRDGVDTLTNVQQAQFSDLTVVFDLHSSEDLLVYEIYQAAYDRIPDNAGFRFWATTADANQMTGLQLSDQFLAAPEFTQKYGANPTNLQYVTELYGNVLGRAPDQAGLTFWVNAANGGEPRDQLLVAFATSPENVGLIGTHVADGYWTTH